MPSGITLIGLGPSGEDGGTMATKTALEQASEVHSLRPLAQLSTVVLDQTPKENTTEVVGNAFHQNGVAQIIKLGQRPTGIHLAIPGHPAIDELLYPHIRQAAQQHKLALNVIPAPSLLDAARTALNITPNQMLQIVTASQVANLHHPPLAPDQAVLITHCHQSLLKQLQHTLLNAYASNNDVTLITNPGGPQEKQAICKLSELAQQTDIDGYTALYLPADVKNSSFATFQETIAHLRAPEGCPWDREQTHQSLRRYLLEEAFEVLETLDANDPDALAEELGDLLLQIVLHTQVAIDTNEFKMGDVIGHIQRKMLRRHPHVFGDITVDSPEEVTANWQAIKQAEKVAKGHTDEVQSVLDGVPKALPALSQALTISKRVVRIGFEWPNIEGVLDKLIEEAKEITEAPDAENLESEIGDFLFTAVNLARWYDIDPESALRGTNARFTRRFKRVEQLAAEQGKNLTKMPLEAMEALWVQAKADGL